MQRDLLLNRIQERKTWVICNHIFDVIEAAKSQGFFVVGGLRGVKTASILNNVVEFQADVMEGINNYVDEASAVAEGECREIITALEAFVVLDKRMNKDE